MREPRPRFAAEQWSSLIRAVVPAGRLHSDLATQDRGETFGGQWFGGKVIAGSGGGRPWERGVCDTVYTHSCASARLLPPSTLCSCLLTGCLSPLQAQHVKQDSVLVFTAGPGAPCVWCTG